jgi:ubiquinone biosynthesis protein
MENAEQILSPVVILSMLPWMLLFAWIARRLLGAKNLSLTSTFISGATGYAAGLSLAIAIYGLPDEPGASTFILVATVFSIGFIMVMIVILELLSERSKKDPLPRVPTVPHPIRAIRFRLNVTRRFVQVIRIVLSYGLGELIGLNRKKGTNDINLDNTAWMTRKMLENAGGMFVKLGQLLSTRVDLISLTAAKEFARLQEHAAPAAPDEIQKVVEEELDRPIKEVFSEFDRKPLAAASLGQVHAARLITGEPVAVKVQRPGIADIVERDLAIVRRLARMIETRTAWGKTYGVLGIAEEFAFRLTEELDYRNEAANASEMARVLDGMADIHVHKIWEDLSTSRILVMERLVGISVGKVNESEKYKNIDNSKLADALLRAELEPMLSGERFHADPHPGNVFLLDDGRLGLLDFGATGRLDAFERASITSMLGALREGDPVLLRESVFEVAEVRRDVNVYTLDRALAQFMVHNLGDGGTPDAAALNELLRVFGSHGIALPSTTATMFRALVTLEGTLNILVPGYKVVEQAERLGHKLTSDAMMPKSMTESAKEELFKLIPLMKRAPRHLDRIATLISRGDLRANVSLFSNREDVNVVTGLVNRSVLALTGSTVGIVSAILLGISGGPDLTSTMTLLDLFGYIGLTAGAVLILRVVLATIRDDII